MQIVAAVFFTLFYDFGFAHQDFSPLAHKINATLESIHGIKSCVDEDESTKQVQTFGDSAPISQYQLKEDCLKQICPRIEEIRNKLSTQDNPMSSQHSELDSDLEPVKQALRDLISSEIALDEDRIKWSENIKTSPLQKTEKMGLAILSLITKNSLENLLKRNLLEGSKTSLKDKKSYADQFLFLGSRDKVAFVGSIKI